MRFTLGPKAQAEGYRIEAHDTVDSTNAVALSRARHGDLGRLWVVSTHQSDGRGRRGRHWGTPPGNLAASLFCLVDAPPRTAATLGFVAGLALDDALRRVVPELSVKIALDGVEPISGIGGDRLRLKWPNDVLLDGGKIAGILLEAEATATGGLAVVIGIGVNVVAAPGGLPYPATALTTLAAGVDASDVFYALSEAWAGLERLWARGAGFGQIRELWLARASGLGEEVAVRVGEAVYGGVFDTIDDDGRLVIRAHDGTVRSISAGEIHFGALAAAQA
jgi:BirA family biotin operon repressor/biotin-[acetyl-CoA-carboxylase] ligase